MIPAAFPTASAYQRELALAVETAQNAGRLLLEMRRTDLRRRLKADRSLVTEADLAAEERILRQLRDHFPEDALLSEESGPIGPAARRCWIVDPLDGTTNYSRGLPFFAVSIALWDDGQPAVGVVYLPVLEELFVAARDTPATLNGLPIRVSETERLEDAVVNTYFDRHERLLEGLDVFRRVAISCEGRVKCYGSTASMLAYVACGRVDGLVRNTTRIWDFAAGLLIAARAGGRVTDFEERPLERSGQSLLATNGRIHAALARVARGEHARG